jgi:protein ImuB
MLSANNKMETGKTGEQNEWLALWLPRLPTDRLHRSATLPERPVIVYDKIKNAFTLTAIDRRASACGLAIGMSLADARAIKPDVMAYQAEPGQDTKLLDEIAAWCERFTPIVVPDPPHGLLLDITGCSHLFGGSASLLQDVERRITTLGFAIRAAIAPTPGAAWALSRAGKIRLVDVDKLQEALIPLPVAALRLVPQASALLNRLGIKTIGQIINAPRQPFAARAGQHAMLRLDQALGRSAEALTPRRPPPPVFALRRMVEPVLTMDAIMIVTQTLCDDLCAQLTERGFGARLLRLSLFGVDSRIRTIELGLSRAESDAKIMLRLLRERLGVSPEKFEAEFGFDAARLDAIEIAPIVLRVVDLAPRTGRDAEAESRLIDRLTARLGPARIGKLKLNPVHAPERASEWTSFHEKPAATAGLIQDGVMRRPLRLFHRAQLVEAIASMPDGPPMRFRWRRILHDVISAEGPERITPDWLRAPSARPRDYYRVEDKEGRRFWLYREDYHDRQEAPRWYVHGLFA